MVDKRRRCTNCEHEGDRALQICGKGIVRAYMREGGRHCIDHDYRPGWEHDGTLFEGL